VLVFIVACGGSVDIEDYNETLVDADCDYLVRCHVFSNSESCKKTFGQLLVDDPSIEAAIDAGKVKYDGDAAQDCFDALEDASCMRDSEQIDACDRIFKGTIPDGGMCAFDEECVSDSCNVPDCTMACCTGTCTPGRPLPTIGQPCTFECVEGAYCGNDSTCQAVLPKGAACEDSLACDRGLYCAGSTGTTAGTCAAYPKTGEPCTTTCGAIGDRCANGTCTPMGLLGAACASNNDCSFFYECDDTMHCAEQPQDPRMPNGSMCTSSTDCESRYCGNDDLCADPPLCI
jgi:hypothetical protein